MRSLRVLAVLLTTALSVLFGIGSVLAALFEMQGFGGPPDQGPRPLYLASLTVAFALCVAGPFVVARIFDRLAYRRRPRSAQADS